MLRDKSCPLFRGLRSIILKFLHSTYATCHDIVHVLVFLSPYDSDSLRAGDSVLFSALSQSGPLSNHPRGPSWTLSQSQTFPFHIKVTTS